MSSYKPHLNRFCRCFIVSDSGSYHYSGVLFMVSDSVLTFRSLDRTYKSINVNDIRELTSKEVNHD